MSLLRCRVSGTGSAFPARHVSNESLARELAPLGVETSDAWIFERTGIRGRYIAATGNPEERNSSLALRASTAALEMAGRRAEDIDFIIYGTCTPDTQVPSAGSWLQAKLGAKRATAFDINAACSGFIYGLTVARCMIASAAAKTCLVIGSEVLSSIINWKDRTSCVLFGDGSGAAVVEACEPGAPGEILGSTLHSDGSQWDLLYIPAGGSAEPLSADTLMAGTNKMTMKGREMFKFATRAMVEEVESILQTCKLSRNDVRWLIPHQANMRIIEAVAERLEFPLDRVVQNIETSANTSAATIPTALDQAVRSGKIQKGDVVAMVAFGAGVTSGATVIRW